MSAESGNTIKTLTEGTLLTGGAVGTIAYFDQNFGFYTLLFTFGTFIIGAILGTVTVRARLAETKHSKNREAREAYAHSQKYGPDPDKIQGTDNHGT